MDPTEKEQERLVMQEEAGQAPIPPEDHTNTAPMSNASPNIDITWRVEGDDPAQYLDLEASLSKFRQLATEALRREGISVDRLPIVIMAEPFLDIRGRISDPPIRRAYDVVSTVWEQGDWKVET